MSRSEGANCSVSNDLFSLIGLQDLMKNALANELREVLHRDLVKKDLLDQIQKDDPDLAEFLSKGLAQASYCNDRFDRPSLCITLAWWPGNIQAYFDHFIALAPKKSGTISNLEDLKRRREELRTLAPRKPSVRMPGYSYPSGRYGDSWIDGDMALFGGLLCLSGEEEGCLLLERSQAESDGQFWRSPDRIGESAPPGEESRYSTFSGDQFNGVVAFILAQNKIDALKKYVRFIDSNRVEFPNSEFRFDFGYKSCKLDANNTCLLLGQEWNWLNVLAEKYQIGDMIPEDSRNVHGRYGYGSNHMEWQATFSPVGYRLHLVGIQVYLARKAGISHDSLQRAAAILAGRQPKNPFFLYLHLGKDQKVAEEIANKCSLNVPLEKRHDWAFQRDEKEEKWKESMGWDCIFMINNLLH